MTRLRLASLFIFLFITAGGAMAQDYGNPDLLVSPEWVLDHADDFDVLVVDVREGTEYETGHVPGAVSFNLDDVTAPENGVPDQVTDAETTAAALGAAGITPEKTIVVYDNFTSLYAARLFWILEYYGYPDVRLLNGGWSVWVNADHPIDETLVAPEAVELELTADPTRRVEGEWIVDHFDDPTMWLLDARAETEFARGRLPGAYNLDWTRLFDADGRFLAPTILEALYADAGVSDNQQQIITYCSTGYRGAVLYFGARLLGYDNVALYDGSWAEWSQHDEWVTEANAS